MFKKVLLQADLTSSQAEILDYLYQNKEAKASKIAKKIKRSRAIVYKEGEELANLGIIEIIDKPNQVSIYQAKHPSELRKLLDLRENKLKKDKELLNMKDKINELSEDNCVMFMWATMPRLDFAIELMKFR